MRLSRSEGGRAPLNASFPLKSLEASDHLEIGIRIKNYLNWCCQIRTDDSWLMRPVL